ncbi:MAG: hypothetical protein ABIL06_21600 [Pseudomonadota bacterium]
MHLKKLVFLIPAFIFLGSYPVTAADYIQVAGLIDLRTTYSDGTLDLESLVELAKGRGFRVLFINDHDRLAMEYGLFPLKNIIRKKVELNSINKEGAKKYLNAIRNVQQRHPDMIIIPGSETAPFYYWTGSYFKGNLTAHDYERRLLTIGMERPEDYADLPIIHNGFSTRYIKYLLPQLITFLISFVLGLYLIRWKGFYRKLGLVITGLSLLFFANANPFRSSPFDQYHGYRGIAPYQLVIDYVNARGGMTFWNYPETRSGVRRMGPVRVDTPPYPEVLEESKGYTGFSALYGDTITVTEPGNLWDRVLMEYCKGDRSRPIWGISTADFHKDGGAGERLGNFPTLFLVQEKTKEKILLAMKHGRMYAYHGNYPQQIVLNDFSVRSSGSRINAISGGEIKLNEHPKIHIFLSSKMPTKNRVSVKLIRCGKVIETFDGLWPMQIDYEDEYLKPGQKIYYRIDVKGCGTLISNPIFVVFE